MILQCPTVNTVRSFGLGEMAVNGQEFKLHTWMIAVNNRAWCVPSSVEWVKQDCWGWLLMPWWMLLMLQCSAGSLIDHHQLFPHVNYALCYSFSQNIILYDVFSNSSNMCCRKCNWPSDTNVTECLIFQYVLLSLKKDAGECPIP
jgi:hypothetical protein